jgi:hypothetical protein
MWTSIYLRLLILARHVAQSAAACMTAMTEGDFQKVTLQHWEIALTTGVVAGLFGVAVSLGPLIRFYDNRWSFAAIAFFGTVIADWWSHPSHFGGPFGEALVTGLGAALLSMLVSYTPIGSRLEKLEKLESLRTIRGPDQHLEGSSPKK